MVDCLQRTLCPVFSLALMLLLGWMGVPGAGRSLSAADTPQPQQQEVVLQMVELHLPQLKSVLDYLRENSPREYERAMRDLTRQMRRLDAASKRGEHIYDNELQIIKLETAIDLGAAKLRLRDEPQLRQQLRRDIHQLQQLRIERLMFERESLTQRLKRATEQLAAVDQRLEKARQTLDANVEQSFETLLRKAGRAESPRSNDKRLNSQQPATQQPSPDSSPAPMNRTKRSPQS